jgi:nucleotide sugar dehydrogenase
MSRVAVVGLGYVGLPLAVRAAEVGHQVIGLDLDLNKIAALQSGVSYVEDVSDERLRIVTDSGRFHGELGQSLHPDTHPELHDFDIAVIAVPTPLREREPDLSYVVSAGRLVGQLVRPGAAVVLESTTYPGTTEGLLRDVLEQESGLVAGEDFFLGFSPERIDPGNTVYTLQNTPKIVSATTAQGLTIIQAFYDTIVDTTVPVSSPKVAELTKLFENTQANVLIALANEVATFCHDLDIDVWEMLGASMTKGHSMSYWTPGPGVGGHCLPIDPMYLDWLSRTSLGRPFRFAELADQVNRERPYLVAQRAAEMLGRRGIDIAGAEVLVLGVAYKPNVGDVRESPALDVVRALAKFGAIVTVVDPYVPDWAETPTLPIEDLAHHIADFPLSIVVTDHRDFDFAKIAALAPLVLDCRNAMPPADKVVAL